MADSAGAANRVPSPADSVHHHSDIAYPWALILSCVVMTIAIAGCIIYLYLHLLNQDKVLFRIDQRLCVLAIHDAKVDRQLASKVHAKIKIEIPIKCSSILD